MNKPLEDCSRAAPTCLGGTGGRQERQDLAEKRENNKVVMEFEHAAMQGNTNGTPADKMDGLAQETAHKVDNGQIVEERSNQIEGDT